MGILKQIWEFIIKIFKFLWGKDIEYTPDEFYSDTRILKPEQIWLFLRRFLVLVLCYMVVSKTYASLNMSWNNYKACKGKDICIIQGPDLNYYRHSSHAQSEIFDNRYILIVGGDGITRRRCSPISPLCWTTNLIYFFKHKNFNNAVVYTPELYDTKKNKFIPLADLNQNLIEPYVIKDSKDNILIKDHKNYDINLVFNKKNKKFETLTKYNFDKNYVYNAPYMLKLNDDKFLTFGNNEDYRLFLHIPKESKVILLENLKLIRYGDYILSYKTNNGDIVIVCPSTTYIFKNDKNIIIEADKSLIDKNKQMLSKLQEYSNYYFKKELDRLNYLQISNTKILVFCLKEGSANKSCTRTFIYDIETGKITDGPIFKFPPSYSEFSKFQDNKWLFTGYLNNNMLNKHCKHTQILVVKNKK